MVKDRWADFVGQGENIDLLKRMDKMHKRAHVLLHGPPGAGKTTLARILSKGNMISCIGSTLKNPDRVSVMVQAAVEQGIDTFFIDEVHSAKSQALEALYPVMEEGLLYIGTPLPAPIFVIAATTDGGRLPKPFVDRFGVEVRLRKYNSDEMIKISKKMAKKLGVSLTEEMFKDVANRSLGIPRTARRILSRLADFNSKYSTMSKYKEIITLTGIDPDGLGSNERLVLETIWSNFVRGPVGIKTLSASTSMDEYLLSKYVEPILIKLGYLTIEKQGRKLTTKGVVRAQKILKEDQSRENRT